MKTDVGQKRKMQNDRIDEAENNKHAAREKTPPWPHTRVLTHENISSEPEVTKAGKKQRVEKENKENDEYRRRAKKKNGNQTTTRK